MCGITAFFARESKIDYKHLDMLFKGAEKRGQDGFGFVIIKRDIETKQTGPGIRRIHCEFKSHQPYSRCNDLVWNAIRDAEFGIGDLIIAIARAAPETEPASDPKRVNETVQPIINMDEGLVVVHNGAVSQKLYNEMLNWAAEHEEYDFETVIDSEAIAAAYIKYGGNMKDAMEYLSGGFAAILYDELKDMLYVINDFKPIAHGYVRGLGFFLHSDLDVLREIIFDITGCARDGVNMWECYYAHYLSGGRIKQIDLQSGFIQNIKYSPRYMTQNWDSNNPKTI